MRNACCLALIFLVAACSKAPEPASTAAANARVAAQPTAASSTANAAGADSAAAETGIAWQKGDVDAAFAKARAENKPVFLYWGAVWCPPCNQVKATIFNRQDFIDRSRFFVPVYLEGDSRSAQRQGARFKVGGYPTMILFKPDGTEITRLPGEVDADQYMRVLAMGMNGARPVKAALASALAARGAKAASTLTPEDWRMLAYYSWDTNEAQLVPQKDVPATLARLAQACPPDQTATATRLALKAINASATVKDAKPTDDKVARERLMSVLADASIARENFDLVTDSADDVVRYVTLPKSQQRAALAAAWDSALQRFVADASLSATDRLLAVGTRVQLAKLDAPAGALPDVLLSSVREQVARGDKETTDPYAREVVINVGSQTLADAGLFDESNALLTAELTRSRTPYYFMLGLAANAKKRGDKAGAVDWTEKAYVAAERSGDPTAMGSGLRQRA